MKTDMEAYFTAYRTSPQASDGTTGVFLATLNDGSSYGSVRDVDDKDGHLIIIPKPPVPTFFPLGDAGGNELTWKKMIDGSEHHTLPYDARAALFIIESDTIRDLKSDAVGGPIDELFITPGHPPSWVHKKANCPG
jgi:hypothetical protein